MGNALAPARDVTGSVIMDRMADAVGSDNWFAVAYVRSRYLARHGTGPLTNIDDSVYLAAEVMSNVLDDSIRTAAAARGGRLVVAANDLLTHFRAVGEAVCGANEARNDQNAQIRWANATQQDCIRSFARWCEAQNRRSGIILTPAIGLAIASLSKQGTASAQ